MKLVNFSITNYRSIIQASRLPITDSTILIGQNNEGKSNILNALAVAIACISPNVLRFLRGRMIPASTDILRLVQGNNHYEWETDYPFSLQERGSGMSIFCLEFDFDVQEIQELQEKIKQKNIKLSNNLKLEIKIDENNRINYKLFKKSRQNAWEIKSFAEKNVLEIAYFIGKRIDFTYIPAIRTSNAAINVVKSMVERELSTLEENPQYIEALNIIEQLQKPILERISDKITQPLQEFIPQIKKVEISIATEERRKALTGCQIIIDDGTPTPIERKGDGIKSLAAISLLRKNIINGKLAILALEEPESHLHPSAIHLLKNVIDELSTNHQVILTTHCPLFVDRVSIRNNILIKNNEAKVAKNITEIRDILGVRASDNLMHAKLVLIVEGEEDQITLTGLFSYFSSLLKESLENATLVIDPLHGASNLSYKISSISASLCNIHILLDNDDAGRKAFTDANAKSLIRQADCHFTNCDGMGNSEMEDCLDIKIYQGILKEEYGVIIDMPDFKNNRSKWSERMQRVYQRHGKLWNENIKREVNMKIAYAANKNPKDSLNEHKRDAIDALITALEEKLQR